MVWSRWHPTFRRSRFCLWYWVGRWSYAEKFFRQPEFEHSKYGFEVTAKPCFFKNDHFEADKPSPWNITLFTLLMIMCSKCHIVPGCGCALGSFCDRAAIHIARIRNLLCIVAKTLCRHKQCMTIHWTKQHVRNYWLRRNKNDEEFISWVRAWRNACLCCNLKRKNNCVIKWQPF